MKYNLDREDWAAQQCATAADASQRKACAEGLVSYYTVNYTDGGAATALRQDHRQGDPGLLPLRRRALQHAGLTAPPLPEGPAPPSPGARTVRTPGGAGPSAYAP